MDPLYDLIRLSHINHDYFANYRSWCMIDVKHHMTDPLLHGVVLPSPPCCRTSPGCTRTCSTSSAGSAPISSLSSRKPIILTTRTWWGFDLNEIVSFYFLMVGEIRLRRQIEFTFFRKHCWSTLIFQFNVEHHHLIIIHMSSKELFNQPVYMISM